MLFRTRSVTHGCLHILNRLQYTEHWNRSATHCRAFVADRSRAVGHAVVASHVGSDTPQLQNHNVGGEPIREHRFPPGYKTQTRWRARRIKWRKISLPFLPVVCVLVYLKEALPTVQVILSRSPC